MRRPRPFLGRHLARPLIPEESPRGRIRFPEAPRRLHRVGVRSFFTPPYTRPFVIKPQLSLQNMTLYCRLLQHRHQPGSAKSCSPTVHA